MATTAFVLVVALAAAGWLLSDSPPGGEPTTGRERTAIDTELSAPQTSAPQTRPPASTASDDSETLPRSVTRMWWNQPPVVETLRLADPQRQAMNATFTRFVIARRERRQSTEATADRKFREALKRGDLSAARRNIDERGEQAAARVTAEARAVVDVLAVLSPEQMQDLAQHFPQLLEKRWFAQLGPATTAPVTPRRRLRRVIGDSAMPAPADGSG